VTAQGLKTIFIIAGPNGSGKTTFAKQFLPSISIDIFVNADEIAREINPADPDGAAITAARIMLERMDELAGAGVDFAFETTLSGQAYRRCISTWIDLGYEVYLYFLSLPTVDIAIERVRLRVSQGGHNIPQHTIERRFVAGSRNFHVIYKSLVTGWEMYDNSQGEPRLLDQG